MAQANKQDAQRRIIEQDRAQAAWRAIETMRSSDQKDDYGTRARGLPAMLQTNGLGATMAFLKARTEKYPAAGSLYEHVSKRIIEYLEYETTNKGDKNLMYLIQNADTETYRRATTEAIAFSIWLKRYCEAEGWKASGS
jgi:CRISPR-associated protein Cmr5